MARRILRTEQWNRIKDILPGKVTDRGVTADNRLFLDAVLWLLRSGAPWRDLPPEFGRWHSVYMRFSRWEKHGVWERVLAAAQEDPDLKALFMDSTAVRAHLHAAGAGKKTVRKHLGDLAAAGGRKST
jgi:putative transposase